MFDSEFLKIAIGMCFLFMVMSITATVFREVIESCMNSRAKDLERGIKEILNESRSIGETKRFYEHPLISSLYPGQYSPGSRSLPSYIPRENFSLAVLDLSAGASATGSRLSMESLRNTLAQVPVGEHTPLQRVIMTSIDVASGELALVRRSLEDWYDGKMDRVSGWYTRRTVWILLAIGLAAAAIGNVDAITVAGRLFQDSPLREAIVKQVENFKLPGDDTAASAEERLARWRSQVEEIGFPVGWKAIGWGLYPKPQTCVMLNPRPIQPSPPAAPVSDHQCAYSFEAVITTLLGWLVTACAVSLGAPFWFELLNRLMVVRSTAKPKEKSTANASPARQPSADASMAPGASSVASRAEDAKTSTNANVAGAP